MSKKILELKNVTVEYYGGYMGCNNLNFEMDEGELLCIFGFPDSGKTSILKALGGLEPYSGNIIYNNKELKSIAVKDRNFGMTFDRLPQRTKLFNLIAYPLKLRKVAKTERTRMVYDIAKRLEITNFLEYPIGMLTPMQKVLAQLARLLVVKRDLYLIDNPLTELYITDRDRMMLEISEKIRLLGKSVIITTDRLSELEMLNADNNIFIYHNQMQAEGTLYNVNARPPSQAVAKLINDDKVNFIPCKYRNSEIFYNDIASGYRPKLINEIFENVLCYLPYHKVKINDKGRDKGEVISIIRGIEHDLIKIKYEYGILYSSAYVGSEYKAGQTIRFDMDFNNTLVYDYSTEKLISK